MDDTVTQPPGSIRLARGAHQSVTDGACLMELASVLAGEQFSDHPKCVHPTLARAARLVNDALTDEDRQQLVPLLPSMMLGPAEGTSAALLIALSCLDTASGYVPPRRFARSRRRVLRGLDRTVASAQLSRLRTLQLRMTEYQAVNGAVHQLRRSGGAGLVAMISDATATHAAVRAPRLLPERSIEVRAGAPA